LISQSLDDGMTEISWLDPLIILAKHKRLLFFIPCVFSVAVALYSLTLPNIYTATTKILPPQQSQSAAAGMLAQLSGLAGFAGAAGIKNPNDLYVAMLTSRTVADNIIHRFNLKEVLEQKYQSDARNLLAKKTRISAGKDGVIAIEVDDVDAQRAAEIANAYADELHKLTNVLAVTEASQRRLFFERQLVQAKDNLTRAEASAKQALQQGGVLQVEGQGRAMIEAAARLRGEITVKEVQIGAMQAFATELNPQLVAAREEIEAMRRALAKMERVRATDVRQNISRSEGQGIGNLGLLRDIKYYETIYELLAKQYEVAKIDEAKNASVIQVLDAAIEPERKSKPWRSLMVAIAAIVSGIFAVFLVFIIESFKKAKQDPAQATRLSKLRHYLLRL